MKRRKKRYKDCNKIQTNNMPTEGYLIKESTRKKLSASKMGNKNPQFGKPISTNHKKRLSFLMKIRWKNKDRHLLQMICENKGEKNCNWKGDKVGYWALHKWVYRILGKPITCEHCGKTGLTGRKIHWANKSGQYLREKNDWLRLCVSCHRKYDLRNNFLHF